MSRAVSVALAIVVISVLLSPLRRELYIGDETKYSEVVREMREGSFFLPTLEGSPFTHKPPLHFWVVDALTYPLGVYSIWPFVLPSLIAFGLLLFVMHRMGGAMAAFVCGTSLMMWGSAQTARMDVEFALLLTMAAWMVRRFFDGERTLIAAAAFTGVAFLVKGPMAPVIILCLIAFEALRVRHLPRANYAIAVLLMLAIPLLWLVPAVIIGGEPFWREIFYKQTVGRAVGSWVHKSPPWFYVLHAPATLLPWFFLLIVAIVRRRSSFAVSWILAVLVPYSLLSSKLDVYMIVMIPAVALATAELVESNDAWGRRANLATLTLLLAIGLAGVFVRPGQIKGPDAQLVARNDVRALFTILAIAAIVAMLITLRASLRSSTLATGLVLVVALAYAGVMLVPIANELASSRPLVRVLERQGVPARDIALYVSPHLWKRGMDPALSHVLYVDAAELRASSPRLIVARRNESAAIADVLAHYRKVDELRMIGKWFDVYRR